MNIAKLTNIQKSHFIFNKNKQKNINSINFRSKYIPVKNINEAKNFAIRNLGLKHYEISDVEVANWLNKALIYIKEITNGKSTILDKVAYKNYADSKGNSKNIMATYQCETFKNVLSPIPHIINDTLVINKNFVKNINEFLDTGKENLINLNILTENSRGLKLTTNYTTKYKNEFERLMNMRYRDMTFEDKMGLNDFLSSLQDYSEFKTTDIDSYVDKFLAYNINKIPLIYRIPLKYGLTGEDKFALLNKCEQIAGVVHNVNIDGKYKPILHETGHMLHAHESPNIFFGNNIQLKRYFRNNLYTASKISQYAKTSPLEYVAETFVKMALKMKLPKDVIDLYRICGGYMF